MLREGMMIVNNRIRNQKGISLISLIITIIVIIILAAIVIFEGFGATESAEFARFTQEFSDYQERISQEYRNKKTNNAIDRIKKKDSEIYSEMGSAEGTVLEVLNGVELQEPLKGTKCYLLTSDREIYDANERVYVTDKGEVFTLPGYEYAINNETRYYVTSSKYYIGDGTVVPGGNSGGSAGTGGTSTGEPVEMTGAPTVEGTIAVGDYVEYLPDSGEYTNNEVPAGKAAKDYYLGHTTSGTRTTNTTTKWRVVRINDGEGETGEILITPANAVNLGTKLTGAPGYINSVRVLDYICGKLYSNSTLGTKARSMRLEDLDYKETGTTIRRAYYANDVASTPNVTVGDVTYAGKRHDALNTSNTYQAITFWEYDEGTDASCIREIELNGYTYRYATPTGDKPVLVTRKSMSGGSKCNGARAVIGGNYGLLASPVTSLSSTDATFGVRGAYSSFVGSNGLANSSGIAYSISYGLRPLVTLGSGLQMETTGEGTPGSESNPWRITK